MSEQQSDNENQSSKVTTIHEHMENFKKHLWSSENPMEFSTQVVEELLLEVQRIRTVMRAGLDELDRHWETHKTAAISLEGDERLLINLMDSLGSRRKGFYPQYLTPEEYQEFISRQVNLNNIAKIYESSSQD